jgi:arylsulfatase A-like enzyme
MLIIRGPDGFYGGHATDALTSQVDLYPTLLELAGAPIPDGIHGRSLLPLVRKQATTVRAQLFAELTYHAAYDPQRAIRTDRYKLIEHFGDRLEPVLPNVDDSPSKSLLIDAGWGSHPRPRVEFYDLVMDPGEMRNLAEAPEFHDLRGDLERRLHEWMAETDDPLLDGPVPVPPGAVVNNPAGISAREPFAEVVD